MKKILVVLLILAVAGGVFAQGSWIISGNVEIGTRINLDTDSGADEWDMWGGTSETGYNPHAATVIGIGYNWWDTPRANFRMQYQNEGATAGLRFNTRDGGPENETYFTYNGENFRFSTMLRGNELLTAGNINAIPHNGSVKRMWGEYDFVDGLVNLLVAYSSEETSFWESDRTAGIGSTLAAQDGRNNGVDVFNHTSNWAPNRYHNNFFGKANTFSFVDENSLIVAQLVLDSLNFGILIPNLFTGSYGNPDNYLIGPQGQSSALRETIFGVKFNMSPIEFAMQFKMRDYGVYFGGRFFAGPIVVGLSFAGLLNPEEDVITGNYDSDRVLKVGGDLAYNAGAFGAGLGASFERWTDLNTDVFTNLTRIQPRFFFNAIPSHLSFVIDAGFYFWKQDDGGDAITDVTWAVQPQLFWNFMGTGANASYPWAGPTYIGAQTGIIFRYRVASRADEEAWGNQGSKSWLSANALDIIFSWNF